MTRAETWTFSAGAMRRLGRNPVVDVDRTTLSPLTDKPSAATTGVLSRSLPVWSGATSASTEVTLTDGLLVEDKIVYGDLKMPATQNLDITFRRCLFLGGSQQPTYSSAVIDCTNQRAGTGKLVLEDCTIDPQVISVARDGIKGHRFTVIRCDISNVVDGIGTYRKSADSSDDCAVIIGQNYVHDLASCYPDTLNSRTSTHNDDWQHQGGRNVWCYGNFFAGSAYVAIGSPAAADGASGGYCGQGVLIQNNTGKGTNADIIVEDNWIDRCTQQFIIKQNCACTYRRNKHYRALYTVDSGWMRIDNTATVTDSGTNKWVDGPYAGLTMVSPRTQGIDYQNYGT